MQNLLNYYQPHSLPGALKLLDELGGQLRPLAGGTDIVPAMAKNELKISGLVDLSKIPGLRHITLAGNDIRLGSLCTFSQVENSDVLRDRAVVLAEAAAAVGSPQIRNLGTIGGNLANASPAADTVTALIALDAVAKLESLGGYRLVPAAKLLCGAGRTDIKPQEIISEISFQVPPSGSRSGFVKLGRRKALAIARMNLAIIITVDGGKIKKARVALGAVGPNPCRSPILEKILLGSPLSQKLLDEFVQASELEVATLLGSRPSAAYKREAVKGIARELLDRLFSESGQGGE